jgi:hypothetical protein
METGLNVGERRETCKEVEEVRRRPNKGGRRVTLYGCQILDVHDSNMLAFMYSLVASPINEAIKRMKKNDIRR